MGLVYANHDFTTNFLSAVGVDDEYMQADIIIDEIGRIISTDKNRVVKMLRDSGVDASYSDNAVRISELVQNEIANNVAFTKKLSRYIVDSRSSDSEIKNFFGFFGIGGKEGKEGSDDSNYNELFGYKVDFNIGKKATDPKAPKTPKTPKDPKSKDDKEKTKFGSALSGLFQDEKTKEGVSNVLAGSMGKLFGGKAGKSSGTSTPTAGEQLTQRVRQNDLMSMRKKNNNLIWYILGGVVVLGAVGFIVYKTRYAKGGMIGGDVPPPVSGTGGSGMGFDPNNIGSMGATRSLVSNI